MLQKGSKQCPFYQVLKCATHCARSLLAHTVRLILLGKEWREWKVKRLAQGLKATLWHSMIKTQVCLAPKPIWWEVKCFGSYIHIHTTAEGLFLRAWVDLLQRKEAPTRDPCRRFWLDDSSTEPRWWGYPLPLLPRLHFGGQGRKIWRKKGLWSSRPLSADQTG